MSAPPSTSFEMELRLFSDIGIRSSVLYAAAIGDYFMSTHDNCGQLGGCFPFRETNHMNGMSYVFSVHEPIQRVWDILS